MKNNRDRSIVWWNVTPTGKWGEDFMVGRQYALTFWKVCGSGRAFALQFQHIILGMLTTVKNYKSPGYSGVEAGFLLALGELSGGVKHIQALLENADARARKARVVDDPRWDEIARGLYTPDGWEFGLRRSGFANSPASV